MIVQSVWIDIQICATHTTDSLACTLLLYALKKSVLAPDQLMEVGLHDEWWFVYTNQRETDLLCTNWLVRLISLRLKAHRDTYSLPVEGVKTCLELFSRPANIRNSRGRSTHASRLPQYCLRPALYYLRAYISPSDWPDTRL